VPTPTEPNRPNKSSSDPQDAPSSTQQPRDDAANQMSAADSSDEATDETVTEAVDLGPSPTRAQPTGRLRQTRRTPLHRKRVDRTTGVVHLLFGAVEDLLADLTVHGAPESGAVRVERLVRNRQRAMGGVATLGIAVTARRTDEILSCWVIVARLELDPWGRPLNTEARRRAATRHRDAQRLIGALVADAGFGVRLGLYRLPEDCYGLAATCTALEQSAATSRTEQALPGAAEETTPPAPPAAEHTPEQGEAHDVQ
jgi:hypothetical protein